MYYHTFSLAVNPVQVFLAFTHPSLSTQLKQLFMNELAIQDIIQLSLEH